MLADIPEDVQLLHETLLEAVQRADLPILAACSTASTKCIKPWMKRSTC